MLGVAGVGSRAGAETAARPEFSTAGFFAVPGSPRRVASFGPSWRFLRADATGAEQRAFDDAGWQTVNLPHGLETLGDNASGKRNYQGPAWYRKRFRRPANAEAAGARYTLYFEAVMGKCRVWVNGQLAAEHFGGYLPFAVELGPLLAPPGEENVVAVRADNSDDATFPPGKPEGELDFAYLGGIYRDVYLLERGAVGVTLPEESARVAGGGVFVGVKALDADAASLEIRTETENRTGTATEVVVRSVLESREGAPLLTREDPVTLGPREARETVQTLQPRQPHRWTPNDPYLHFLRTEIVRDGKIVDSLRTRFGVRRFELKGREGLLLNGAALAGKLNGANRHQDYAQVGNALPQSGQWRDARLLREGGCTVIRAAHYPLSPAFMDACDALGLLVTSATPGWQFFNDRDPVFARRVLEDCHALARRDRNRPALLLWETTLNETSNLPAGLLGQMRAAVHEECPFPGCFTAADAADAVAGGMEMPYSVEPWGGEDQVYFTREYGDVVDTFWNHNSPVRIKREWGERALAQQARRREKQIDALYQGPARHVGGALWAGIDHQRGYAPDPFWGGLLDVYRVPRYAYFLYQSQYDPGLKVPGIATGPMVHVCHELTYLSEPDVTVYTNCEEVRLTWLGKVAGTRKPLPGRHEPHPPVVFPNVFDPEEIQGAIQHSASLEMVAEGLIGGTVACREVKAYPQRAVGLKLRVDDLGVPLQADGADFVPVRASVVDREGTARVLESGYVHFRVEGPGEIIGSEARQTNPIKVEFGVASALVRAGLTPGTIRVTAESEGLGSAQVELRSVPPALPLVGGEGGR